MTLSKNRRRLLLLPLPAVALAAAGAVAATAAFADPTALEWRDTEPPDLGTDYSLSGVAAPADDDVWAVGTDNPQDEGKPVALHWDGVKWSDTAAPGASLNDITAVDGEVWAVGAADREATISTRWDGEKWEEITTPQPQVPEDQSLSLNALDGVAADDVWAVGSTFGPEYPTGASAILQHWDGEEWSLVDVPLPAEATGGGLGNVYAKASDDVWATGAYYDDAETQRQLLLHWDGDKWSIQDLTMPRGVIRDIEFTEDGRVWLAGTRLPEATSEGSPMLLVGDGEDFTELDLPVDTGSLYAMTTDGDGGIVAVGDDDDQAMVLGSDGKTVTRQAAPAIEPGADYSALSDIALVPGTDTLWTVGFLNKFTTPLAAHTV